MHCFCCRHSCPLCPSSCEEITTDLDHVISCTADYADSSSCMLCCVQADTVAWRLPGLLHLLFHRAQCRSGNTFALLTCIETVCVRVCDTPLQDSCHKHLQQLLLLDVHIKCSKPYQSANPWPNEARVALIQLCLKSSSALSLIHSWGLEFCGTVQPCCACQDISMV